MTLCRRGEREEPGGADLLRDVQRRLIRMGWAGGIAGAVVVFIAIGFLIPIFIDPGERTDLALLNAPADRRSTSWWPG